MASISSDSRSRIALAYSGAIESMKRGAARTWTAAAAAIDGGFETLTNASGRGVRPRHPGGRHHAGPDFPNHLLPELSVPGMFVRSACSSDSSPERVRSL